MKRIITLGVCLLISSAWANAQEAASPTANLATASAEDLLRVYGQLRQLHAGDQWAVAEGVTWKRDSGTFTFRDGRLTFAAPVEGRVLAAVFEGQGQFELNPASPIARGQLSRFTKQPRLQDSFKEAVFFFTDDSFSELRKQVKVQSGGGAQAPGRQIESALKKYSENFNDWWENQRKGNFPMRNLAARALADLTDPSSRGFFLADFKGDSFGDLLFHISWNRDSILLPGFANDEEVQLIHYNRGNWFEWWGGFHLAEEYARTPHPEHRTLLAHARQARIQAEVSKDNHISATADLEVEVPTFPARLLSLNLEGVLRITAIEGAGSSKLSFIQEDARLNSEPWVILPAPAAAGQVFPLRIAYQEHSNNDSRIVHQEGQGLYFVTARESWFPSFGAFDDRTQFSMRVRSPKKYKFLGTGRLVKSSESGDFRETEWESEIPYGVIGFNYGDFVEKSQTDPNLTVTAYSGKEIPNELKNVQSALSIAQLAGGPNQGDVASRAGIMEGGFNTSRLAGYAAGVSYQGLKLYEYYYGSLPFKSVSVTEQPVRGFGQSWPTLIFLPYDSLLDATTRHSLRLQVSAEQAEFYNIVAVHEMAHQWWGHVVGWKTYHDQWLSEGFAEFSAALYLEKFDPKRWNDFWAIKRKWLFSSTRSGARPVDAGPLWLNYQLNTQLAPEISTFLIYFKGAYVLEMLRTIMKDSRQQNPDGKFMAMMHDFVTTYSGKNASTDDFRKVVEKHMGEPMDWFFNQWVYGTETPQYDFTYQIKPGEGGKSELQFSIKQSGVSGSFEGRVPIYIYLKGQPRRLGLLVVRGSTTVTDKIPLPVTPEKVTLDETHSMLCTMRQP